VACSDSTWIDTLELLAGLNSRHHIFDEFSSSRGLGVCCKLLLEHPHGLLHLASDVVGNAGEVPTSSAAAALD